MDVLDQKKFLANRPYFIYKHNPFYMKSLGSFDAVMVFLK